METHFGIERHVDALVRRLEAYFEGGPVGAARGDQALVIGVYGPWGCGKTTWLRQISAEVELRQQQRLRELDTGSLTIPIQFNAWQFEREPHLIIPLLKTAEATLRRYVETNAPTRRTPAFWRAIRASLVMLGEATVAVASGLHGEFSLGMGMDFGQIGQMNVSGGPNLSVDSGKIVETFARRRHARKTASNTHPRRCGAHWPAVTTTRSLASPSPFTSTCCS